MDRTALSFVQEFYIRLSETVFSFVRTQARSVDWRKYFGKKKVASSFTFELCYCVTTLIKKENQIFLIDKEIHNGAVAKSYMVERAS